MDVHGVRTFTAGADAYDRFMGRYSGPLAVGFSAFAGAGPGARVLDVGCGPGALTVELVRLVGAAGAVSACDPSPTFVAACRQRFPGVEVRAGAAERLPFPDAGFDLVASQLVLRFVSDPAAAGTEVARVLRAGGVAAACVWDGGDGMDFLRSFWDAAAELDVDAPDEQRRGRTFGAPGELAAWLSDAGFGSVEETSLVVYGEYESFEELWSTLLAGVGPVGAYCATLSSTHLAALRSRLRTRLGSPPGAFSVRALARAARGVRH